MADGSKIAHRDWRLHGITTLAAPFTSPWSGETYLEGTPVEVVGTLRVGNQDFHTPVPDAVALYLAVAVGAEQRARAMQAILGNLAGDTGSNTAPASDLKSAEREYFDALQELVTLVIFSYSSIEAFANLTIPEGYVHRRVRADGRCTEEYDRLQIERNIPLAEKLDVILPAITQANSPKGTELWRRFVYLQRLRDRLIHLKPSDWRPSRPEAPADVVWSDLVADEVSTVCDIALAIIAHFTPEEKPRWFQLLSGRRSAA